MKATAPIRHWSFAGATIITGNGGPPFGPAEIVIKGNRIAEICSASTPGLPVRTDRPASGAPRDIDATGMFVLPGLVDMHGHNGDADKAPDPSYAYRMLGSGWDQGRVQTLKAARTGVRWTIKDGMVFDAPALLKSVADQVAREKAAAPK